VTTHNVIAHRALQWLGDNYPALSPYAALLRDPTNQHAFQNGAAFPDWGYACPLAHLGYPKLPDMSEAAHWVRVVFTFIARACVRACVRDGA
jgi:hypothetical protein